MRTDRASRAVAAATAVFLVCCVAAAAVGGAWQLEARPFLDRWSGLGSTARPPTPALPPATMPQHPNPSGQRANLHWLVILLLVFAAVALAWFLWWLWQRYQRSALEARRARAAGGDLSLLAEPVADLPVLRHGVRAAQHSLDEIADPNNAIVAAWLALEEAASTSGIRREAAQTPTEFTVEVLAGTKADPEATRGLLTLYHRARFSAAGVSRTDVATASRYLGVLASGWDAIKTTFVDPDELPHLSGPWGPDEQ